MSKFKFMPGSRVVSMPFWEAVNDPGVIQKRKKVWYNVRTICTAGLPNPKNEEKEFEWPEYNSESQRIKANTAEAKDLTITEAFSKLLGVEISVNKDLQTKVDCVPPELKVGDEIDMMIKNVSKDGVEFECINLKQTISSSVNLWKYQNFKRFTPKDTITVRVVKSTPQQIVVDPISHMLDEYLGPIIADPTIQNIMEGDVKPITVKNLKLTRGGFLGQAVIPNISSWVGEDYTIDAFIPGSQIVLNIEDNFEKWNGKTVQAFITNYIQKPGPDGKPKMSLICSVKERLKFEGGKLLIETFKKWCENEEFRKELATRTWEGCVTGVIHAAKKCGAFVEIPDLNITGFVTTAPDKLVDYRPHDHVKVNWVDIEENVYFDKETGQSVHGVPYVIEDGVLKKCYIKPILKFVDA